MEAQIAIITIINSFVTDELKLTPLAAILCLNLDFTINWLSLASICFVEYLPIFSLPEGSMLWLGTNGSVTNIEPVAPVSKISVGMVLRSNANNGVVYVKIRAIARNQKLSDVYAPTLTGGDVLRWNSTTLRFETFNITSALGSKVDTSRAVTAGMV